MTCCAYCAGECSVEVKIEADSNDSTEHLHDDKPRASFCSGERSFELKIESDCNDVTVHPDDVKPTHIC